MATIMSMNRLSKEKRIRVLSALVEGVGINSITRMTGVSKVTICKMLLDVGAACMNFEDTRLRGLNCRNFEADEIWGFAGAKDRNVPESRKDEFGIGSVWTWFCICQDSRLLVSWIMGNRDREHAVGLMRDLAQRIEHRPTISTDGLQAYEYAIREAFGVFGADHAMIVKMYGKTQDTEARYSPARCIGCEKTAVFGEPDMNRATTSHVERANLTLRMQQRRWTRLTNGHSKSFTHMQAAFALFAWHYNWARKNAAVKMTPAQKAGLADRAFTFDDLVDILDTHLAG